MNLGYSPFNIRQSERVQNMDETISLFDTIPQKQAAASEYRLVDTSYHEQIRATSFESFTHPFFDTDTEITRPLYSRDNTVDGLSMHKTQDSTSAPNIYPNSAQEKDPLLHPNHAEIIIPHLIKNTHDGHYISDIRSTYFETPSILKRYQESQESQKSDISL